MGRDPKVRRNMPRNSGNSLRDLTVDLKHEFNQHNRNMYGSGSDKALIAEADIAG